MENPCGFAATFIHNRTIARHCSQKLWRKDRHYVIKMSVNGAPTPCGHASWKKQGLSGDIKP